MEESERGRLKVKEGRCVGEEGSRFESTRGERESNVSVIMNNKSLSTYLYKCDVRVVPEANGIQTLFFLSMCYAYHDFNKILGVTLSPNTYSNKTTYT